MRRRRVDASSDASTASSTSSTAATSTGRRATSRRGVDWTLWTLRLLPFLLAVTTSGYIVRLLTDRAGLMRQHPDELFQNAEVAVRDIFAFAGGPEAQPLRTWEWASDRPCRSIVPVWLTTGWAFALLKLVVAAPCASPREDLQR